METNNLQSTMKEMAEKHNLKIFLAKVTFLTSVIAIQSKHEMI